MILQPIGNGLSAFTAMQGNVTVPHTSMQTYAGNATKGAKSHQLITGWVFEAKHCANAFSPGYMGGLSMWINVGAQFYMNNIMNSFLRVPIW